MRAQKTGEEEKAGAMTQSISKACMRIHVDTIH